MARINTQRSTTGITMKGSGRYGPWDKTTSEGSRLTLSTSRGDVVKSRVTNGFRPPLPYSASGYDTSLYYINLHLDYKIQGVSYDMDAFGTEYDYVMAAPSVESLISSNQINSSTVSMLKKIGDAKFSAGQALIELQESVDMIGSTASTLARALTAGLRKDWKSVARILKVSPKNLKANQKDMANGWLAYSFGWTPLVGDIANAALALGGHLDRRSSPLLEAHTRIVEYKQVNRLNLTACSVSGYDTGTGMGVTVNLQDTIHDEYRASLYYEVNLSSLNELSRYGLVGLSTPWAVLPWSFLVDWVLPIGDILAAMDTTVGLTYKGGSYTRFQKSTTRLVGVNRFTTTTPSAWLPVVTGSVEAADAHSFHMSRTVWPNSPSPFQPYVKNPLSAWKAVTGIALLRQVKP